jgi:hypothetical protein
MKIKALTKLVIKATTVKPGKTIDVPDAVAANLIKEKRAEKAAAGKTK